MVDHLTYSGVDEEYGVDIFTEEKLPAHSSRAVKTNRHILDYVFTHSTNEREFVALLDGGTEIEGYARLSKAFSIPTPVDGYSAERAIALSRARQACVFCRRDKGSNVVVEVPETSATS